MRASTPLRITFLGLFGALILHACVDSRRTPTAPSPGSVEIAAEIPWTCGQTGRVRQEISGTGEWKFATPACPAGPVSALSSGSAPIIFGAPGNLRSTINGTTVRLDWNAVPEVVSSHLLEAGSGPGLSNIAAFNTGSSQTFVVVPGVPPGVYYVRVRAVGPDGLPGPPSNEIELRVGGSCSTSPGIPTGFTHSVAGNTVTLSWDASVGVDPPTSYVVEAGSLPGLSNITVFDTGSAATGLSASAPNGVYYVRIRARNACGVSGASNERTIAVGVTLTTTPTTTTVPPAPGTTTTTTTTAPSTAPTTTMATTSTLATVSIKGPSSCSVDDARGCSNCVFTATTSMTNPTYTWSLGLMGSMVGGASVSPDWRKAYCAFFNGGGTSTMVDMTVTVSNSQGNKATSPVHELKLFTT
jgi:hypothetical protein